MRAGVRRRRLFVVGMLLCSLLPPWLGEVYYPWPFRHAFLAASGKTGISPYLLAAVARSESRFDPQAQSRRGAVGLMQLLPSTAAYLTHRTRRAAAAELQDPDFSIDIGAEYLGMLVQEFGAMTPAIAAYNSGDATVRSWIAKGSWRPGLPLQRIPYPETRMFVRRVLTDARWYGYLYPGLVRSEGMYQKAAPAPGTAACRPIRRVLI